MGSPDTVLLQRWVAGRDPEAFAELVARHAGMVYGTCRRILGNAADAEDVAQDCFVKLALADTPIKKSVTGWSPRPTPCSLEMRGNFEPRMFHLTLQKRDVYKTVAYQVCRCERRSTWSTVAQNRRQLLPHLLSFQGSPSPCKGHHYRIRLLNQISS